MYKIIISLTIVFFSLGHGLFSQESNILTKFSQAGSLFNNIDETQALVEFKKNEECKVIGYFGDDIYKVLYDNRLGFVNAENLLVSNAMIDLVIAFEDKERLAAIKREEERKRRVEQIIKGNEEEKQESDDSYISEAESIIENESVQLDSIARVQEKIKERQVFIKDSIAKLEKEKLEEIESKRQDSIAKIQENIRLAVMARQKDSLANIEAAKKLREIAIRDSIFKAEEAKRMAVVSRKQDSLERIQLIARQKDSLKKIEETKKQREKEVKDSIFKAEERKRKEIEQREKDSRGSIAKNKKINSEDETTFKEETKSKTECKYLINEFDEFYGIRIIRTEPYEISKQLTAELHRQGQSKNLFLNLSEDLGCASYFTHNRSYVKITLENDEVVTLYHTWDMDCGDFSFKAKLSDVKIESLKKSLIKSIFLQGTEGNYQINDIANKAFFIDYLRCIE